MVMEEPHQVVSVAYLEGGVAKRVWWQGFKFRAATRRKSRVMGPMRGWSDRVALTTECGGEQKRGAEGAGDGRWRVLGVGVVREKTRVQRRHGQGAQQAAGNMQVNPEAVRWWGRGSEVRRITRAPTVPWSVRCEENRRQWAEGSGVSQGVDTGQVLGKVGRRNRR